MDLLVVLSTICHRKTLLFAVLNCIIISFVTTKCQSLATGRTVQDMRNPRIATDKCGRQGIVSNVCDPDRVISSSEGKLSNSICFCCSKYRVGQESLGTMKAHMFMCSLILIPHWPHRLIRQRRWWVLAEPRSTQLTLMCPACDVIHKINTGV